VTHGFDLDEADRLLLRGPPPAEALRWCADAVGPGARVVGVTPLEGGTSSAMHAVDVERRRGVVHRLVLRRFVRREWLEEEPGVARREAAALELLHHRPVPAPELVAVDTDADVPALLMTRLQGRIEWRPAELDPYLRRLAEALPAIHATPLTDGHAIPAYEPYELEADGPPRWSSRPGTWERAFEVYRGPAPPGERRFLHRDYHPGNVLWSGGAITGIVDWPTASVGAPASDVGYCRLNLAWELGIEAAERFLALYRAVSGRDEHHPYWDVVAALGGFSEDHWTGNDQRFLEFTLAQL
jgi:aminoglycoside phosphotransferase (APT) family kinase protein